MSTESVRDQQSVPRECCTFWTRKPCCLTTSIIARVNLPDHHQVRNHSSKNRPNLTPSITARSNTCRTRTGDNVLPSFPCSPKFLVRDQQFNPRTLPCVSSSRLPVHQISNPGLYPTPNLTARICILVINKLTTSFTLPRLNYHLPHIKSNTIKHPSAHPPTRDLWTIHPPRDC